MRGEKTDGFQRWIPLYLDLLIGKWKLRFGFEYSRVGLGDTPYLDRYILYVGTGTLRLHKFWRGDDMRAPHDHPWWFITFPFRTYTEIAEVCKYGGGVPNDQTGVPSDAVNLCTQRCIRRIERTVTAWRPHFRPALYRHIVKDAACPFWTFVITGGPSNSWGFWPRPERFVPHREWTQYVRDHQL
jgi:hypothetical protein